MTATRAQNVLHIILLHTVHTLHVAVVKTFKDQTGTIQLLNDIKQYFIRGTNSDIRLADS